MKSLAELQAIKNKMKDRVVLRDGMDGIRVVVGMATCGIAAGARPVMHAFMDEVNKRQLKHVTISQTGCIGMCRLEPMVDVITPDGNKVTYVHVKPEMVSRIVTEHVVNGRPVEEYTIGAAEDR